MTSRLLVIASFFLLSTSLPLPAEHNAWPASGEIVVTGVGRSDEEALLDAFRTAVRTAVGTLVDSEKVTKDGDLSRRNQITYGQGIVQSYPKLAQRRVGAER